MVYSQYRQPQTSLWKAKEEDLMSKKWGKKIRRLPLGGTVMGSLLIRAYSSSLADGIIIDRWGDPIYPRDKASLWSWDKVGLTNDVLMDLVMFNRFPSPDEIVEWCKMNGKKPLGPEHALGLFLQYLAIMEWDRLTLMEGGRHHPLIERYSNGEFSEDIRIEYFGFTFPGSFAKECCLFGFVND
jgi:hypothetical protein